MTSSSRARGDYFERQTRDALKAHDWLVIRSAGSLGVADLVALRMGNTPLLVSCKLGGRIDPGERDDLELAARSAGARPVVASRPKNGRVSLHLLRGDHRALLAELRVPPRPRTPKGGADDE